MDDDRWWVPALVHAVAGPLLIGLERLTWYGWRAVLFVVVLDAGLDTAELGTLLTATGALSVTLPLLGGLLALAVGPYVTMVLGGLLLAVGYVWLSGSPVDALLLPLAVIAAGSSLVRPCAWAAVAQALPSPREHLRAGALILLYGAVNLSAVGITPIAPRAVEAWGAPSWFWTLGLLCLGIPLLAVAQWASTSTVTWRTPELPEVGRSAGIALAVTALTAPFALVLGASGTVYMAAAGLSGSALVDTLTQAANPVAVLVGSGVLLVLLGVAHGVGLRWPPLVVTGAAMVAGALALAVGHPAVIGVGGLAAVGAAIVGLGLAESAVTPIVLARIGGDGHWRLAPLLVAVWMCATYGVAWGADLLAGWLGGGVVLGLAVAASGLAGVLLVAGALAGRRWLMPQVQTD